MDWLRLHHDMPNDPKFKTIAKLSKTPISLVLSVYLHLLVSASRNVTRGHVDVTNEDLASALDVEIESINNIIDTMEGRLLDNKKLTGWEKRQVKKEDQGVDKEGVLSPAERKRQQRERDLSRNVTRCHEMSRDVTTDKIRLDNKRNNIKKNKSKKN